MLTAAAGALNDGIQQMEAEHQRLTDVDVPGPGIPRRG
jgi:hypothetical protein